MREGIAYAEACGSSEPLLQTKMREPPAECGRLGNLEEILQDVSRKCLNFLTLLRGEGGL